MYTSRYVYTYVIYAHIPHEEGLEILKCFPDKREDV